MQRMRGRGPQGSLGSPPRLSELRALPPSRRERGEEHPRPRAPGPDRASGAQRRPPGQACPEKPPPYETCRFIPDITRGGPSEDPPMPLARTIAPTDPERLTLV